MGRGSSCKAKGDTSARTQREVWNFLQPIQVYYTVGIGEHGDIRRAHL
jgi:hypothetical protein